MRIALCSSLFLFLFVGRSAPVAAAIPGWSVVAGVGDPTDVRGVVGWRGKVWACTAGGGLVAVDPKTATPSGRLGARDGLPGDRVTGCVVSGDHLWVSTSAGLASATGDGTVALRASGRFVGVAAGSDGIVAARADGAVVAPDGTILGSLGATPVAIAAGADGIWLVGGYDGQVVGPRDRWKLPGPVSALHLGPDGAIAQLAHEAWWRLARGGGATPMTGRGPTDLRGAGAPTHGVLVRGLWREPPAPGSGAEATEWVATDAGLWRRADGETWQTVDLGGLPCGHRIAAIASFAGDLWAGSFDRGLCRFDGRRWSRVAGAATLPSEQIHDLAAGRDHLVVATAGGVALIDAQGAVDARTVRQCVGNTRAACPWHPTVNGVTADRRSGRVWIADSGAVHRVDGAHRWRHHYRRAGITSQRLTRVAAWSGHVAVGSGDMGLFLGRRGRFERLDDQDGLADNWVTDLDFTDRGALWVGTCTRGVSRLRRHGRRMIWQTFTTADGLVDDAVLAVRALAGAVWVGTAAGLGHYRDGRWSSLTPTEGLGGQEVHDMVLHRGRLWIATDGGLTALARTPLVANDHATPSL